MIEYCVFHHNTSLWGSVYPLRHAPMCRKCQFHLVCCTRIKEQVTPSTSSCCLSSVKEDTGITMYTNPHQCGPTLDAKVCHQYYYLLGIQMLYTLQSATGACRSSIQGMTADVHGYLLMHWATVWVRVGYLHSTPSWRGAE